jgi:hypothetical protein
VAEEIRTLIRRMAAENAGWGAPKIHGELLKLGFAVSERTVARHLKRTLVEHDRKRRYLAVCERSGAGLGGRHEVVGRVCGDRSFCSFSTFVVESLYHRACAALALGDRRSIRIASQDAARRASVRLRGDAIGALGTVALEGLDLQAELLRSSDDLFFRRAQSSCSAGGMRSVQHARTYPQIPPKTLIFFRRFWITWTCSRRLPTGSASAAAMPRSSAASLRPGRTSCTSNTATREPLARLA